MTDPGGSSIQTAQDWARENRTTRRLAYAMIVACIITFAMGQTILFTVLGPLARDIGLEEYHVGLIVTLSALAMALVQPLWGRLSDHWGRKVVIIFGLAAYGVTTTIFTFLIQIGLWAWLAPVPLLFLLIVARITYALTSSGIQPSATAYIADTTTGTERAAGVALIGAAVGLGTVGGPILGFAVVGFGVLVPLYAAAGIAFVMALLAIPFLREPPAHVRTSPGKKIGLKGGIIAYLIITTVLLTITAATQQTAAFYVQDRLGLNAAQTTRAVGIAMALTAVVTIFVQGIVVQWLKPAPAVLVRTGLIIGTTAFVFLSYTKAYEGLVIGYMILGASFGLLNPGLMSAASLSVGPEEQGSVAGMVGSAMSAGFIFGPILGTSLYQFGQVVPLAVNAAAMALMLAASFFLYFAPRPAHLPGGGGGE